MAMMLLKQMLEAPTTSPNLVVLDPFQAIYRNTLVKEVVGLANADIEGPRHILFGVNTGGTDDKKLIGIPDDALGELKRAHRLISSLVEPALELAFIFDRINGRLIGALEIDGCDFGPYFVAQDLSDELRRGACWVRRERDLVAVERHELLNGSARSMESPTPVLGVSPGEFSLLVGFNQDPYCEFLEVDVPDTSDPPFAEEYLRGITTDAGTDTSDPRNLGTKQQDRSEDAEDPDDIGNQIAIAATQHYFYEERAVKIALCVRNDSDADVSDVRAELGFPRFPGFDVADRIYTSPFDKRIDGQVDQRGYPNVEYQDDAIFVRATVGDLPARQTQPLIRTPLRLAVGPEALGKKVAMQYVVRTADGRKLDSGRLKIRLSRQPVAAPGDDATEVADLNMA